MEEPQIDLYTQLVESQLIVREILKLSIKGGETIIVNKFINSQMPQIGYEWFIDQVATLMEKSYLDFDDIEDFIEEDQEPGQVNIEHWRRFQGQVTKTKSREQSPIRRSDGRRTTKMITIKTRRESEGYNSQIIKMGELDDDIEFDPNIESMRQAKIRQLTIQQQKELNDKVKIQEVQEQAKQLKRLNVDSKSKYTYDFEGKVVVQKPPDIDRYPKSHQNILEKRNLVEVRDLMPNHKLSSELITFGKKLSAQVTTSNQFAIKTSVPQIDLIIMKEGVTFSDGRSEKKKERQFPLLDIKDTLILQQTLQKQNVQMTKTEYQKVTNTTQANTFQNKTLSFSASQQLPLQQNNNLSTRTQYEDQQPLHANDSLLSYRMPKAATVNHSISSSILQKLNGSISILSEQQLEELIETKFNQQQTARDHPLFKKKKTEILPKTTNPPPPLTLDLPVIPPNILSNSLSKLPKSYQSPGTFPKLIPKYPRDRISKQAIHLRIEI